MIARTTAFAAALLTLASAAALAHEVTSKGVTVAHPWARATPEGSTVGAAYMEVKTADGTTDKLLSATSPVAGRVEIHTHAMEGDVMKMRKVDAVELTAGKSHGRSRHAFRPQAAAEGRRSFKDDPDF
jgi:periplasmic copper chaperone A